MYGSLKNFDVYSFIEYTYKYNECAVILGIAMFSFEKAVQIIPDRLHSISRYLAQKCGRRAGTWLR